MEYRIAISPNLDVAADEFAVAWNEDPACREVGQALIAKDAASLAYIDPAVIRQGLIMLGGVVGGLALEPLKDLLKERIKAYLDQRLPTPAPPVEVIQVPQPDGGILLVVKEVA
jgi:hypothetical protein